MIVLDTTVFIDALIPFTKDRHEKAISIINEVDKRSLILYEPKLFLIELAGVLSRFKNRMQVMTHIKHISEHINILDYDELHENALNVSLLTGCRAVDAFFVATAEKTKSILISCDRKMVVNGKKAGVESYYIVDDYDDVMERMGTL